MRERTIHNPHVPGRPYERVGIGRCRGSCKSLLACVAGTITADIRTIDAQIVCALALVKELNACNLVVLPVSSTVHGFQGASVSAAGRRVSGSGDGGDGGATATAATAMAAAAAGCGGAAAAGSAASRRAASTARARPGARAPHLLPRRQRAAGRRPARWVRAGWRTTGCAVRARWRRTARRRLARSAPPPVRRETPHPPPPPPPSPLPQGPRIRRLGLRWAARRHDLR